MTVADYLAQLTPERRAAMEALRNAILENLDPDLEEGIQYGMISYFVPHRIYPPGYHCDPSQPLPFVCLASQKNHMSLHMACIYAGPRAQSFREAWARTGKKMDMGKACVRFKKLDDLPLDVIGGTIASVPVQELIGFYRLAVERTPMKRSEIAARTKAKKAAKKRTIKKSAKKTPGKQAPKKSAARKK